MSAIPFWIKEPTILFKNDHLLELWPTTSMCYEQKLNAISRLVIVLSILGYIATGALRVLAVGVLTLAGIWVLYSMRARANAEEEGFQMANGSTAVQALTKGASLKKSPKSGNVQVASLVNPVTLDEVLRTEFKEGTKKNPFSNVLLTQIGDEPERKAAPPSFNVEVDEDITKNVKRAVQMMNPTIKNTNKQLFGDLWQQFQLDQSNRAFYSTANTRVASDQGAFAQFLYGNMPSGKESTPEGAMARVQNNYRYTLY